MTQFYELKQGATFLFVGREAEGTFVKVSETLVRPGKRSAPVGVDNVVAAVIEVNTRENLVRMAEGLVGQCLFHGIEVDEVIDKAKQKFS